MGYFLKRHSISYAVMKDKVGQHLLNKSSRKKYTSWDIHKILFLWLMIRGTK